MGSREGESALAILREITPDDGNAAKGVGGMTCAPMKRAAGMPLP